jgi:hypothetical protein
MLRRRGWRDPGADWIWCGSVMRGIYRGQGTSPAFGAPVNPGARREPEPGRIQRVGRTPVQVPAARATPPAFLIHPSFHPGDFAGFNLIATDVSVILSFLAVEIGKAAHDADILLMLLAAVVPEMESRDPQSDAARSSRVFRICATVAATRTS